MIEKLGWNPFFSRQLTLEELESCVPARVVAIHRSGIVTRDAEGEQVVALLGHWFQRVTEERPTVGDWVLLTPSRDKVVRLLDRMSLFQRVAAGPKADMQLIAANVDTLFVVSSCNDDFNESRLERYLALALESNVQPVVVLTKMDLAGSADDYLDRARRVAKDVVVEAVNALDPQTLEGVTAWIRPGQTVALVGSSGVGKSTLLNTLAGREVQATREIREDDAKGRHTTTSRSLHLLPEGGVLLDVPGMRELGVADIEPALGEMFEDIDAFAERCRFADCGHGSEPGCAINEAIESGALDERRVASYFKLLREQARNTATLAEQRHRSRQFSKGVRRSMREKERLFYPKGE